MRLIGNKTKLLGQIEGFLAERRVRSGTFLDVFAGTASVGQHFRRLGFTVHTNDLLAASYVRQRATVALGRCPRLSAVVKTPEVRAFCASAPGEAALARTPAPDGASARLFQIPGTRDWVRNLAAYISLERLRRYLLGIEDEVRWVGRAAVGKRPRG